MRIEKTLKDTVGVGYARLRLLSGLVMFGSIGLCFINPVAAFATLFGSTAVYIMLISRVYYIETVRKSGTIADLRWVLLPFNKEYVFKDLAKDNVWYGRENSEDLNAKLEEVEAEKAAYSKLKDELTAQIESFARDMFGSANDSKTPGSDTGNN